MTNKMFASCKFESVVVNMKKTLGVLGGMGPLATALFLEYIASYTEVERDQDHLSIITYSVPSLPDRSDFILGKSPESPLPQILDYITKLKQDADLIAVPCVTVMHFYDEMSKIDVPILNIAQLAADEAKKNSSQIGIMATTGTIASKIFDKYLDNYIIPSPDYQKLMMDIIYNIKSSGQFSKKDFDAITLHLEEKQATKIILGCTELSFINRSFALGEIFTDALQVLAEKSIETMGKKIRRPYG